MALTEQEFAEGVNYWRCTRWPQDFHNGFYQRMQRLNSNEKFNNRWWRGFIQVLGQWRAIRPKSQNYLTARATERWDQLSRDWEICIAPLLEYDISSVSWGQIASFATTVSEIKNVNSPVFTSKFCHFLAPHIFPVVDNAAMGNNFGNYQSYYCTARREWDNTDPDTRNALEERIATLVGDEIVLFYPKKCKITELCLIGRHQG